jgi:hypothetical protein
VTGNSSSLLQNTSNILNNSSGVNGSSSMMDHAPKTGDYYASNENYANFSGDTSGRLLGSSGRLLGSSGDVGRSISPNNTGRSVSPGHDRSGVVGNADGAVMARIKMVTIPLKQERGPSPPPERSPERGRGPGVSQERVLGTREYVRTVSPHEGGDRRRSSLRGDFPQQGARVVVASARGQAMPSDDDGSITYVTDNRRMRSVSPSPGANRRRSAALSEHEEMAGVGLVLKRSQEGVYTVVKTVPGHQVHMT